MAGGSLKGKRLVLNHLIFFCIDPFYSHAGNPDISSRVLIQRDYSATISGLKETLNLKFVPLHLSFLRICLLRPACYCLKLWKILLAPCFLFSRWVSYYLFIYIYILLFSLLRNAWCAWSRMLCEVNTKTKGLFSSCMYFIRTNLNQAVNAH